MFKGYVQKSLLGWSLVYGTSYVDSQGPVFEVHALSDYLVSNIFLRSNTTGAMEHGCALVVTHTISYTRLEGWHKIQGINGGIRGLL